MSSELHGGWVPPPGLYMETNALLLKSCRAGGLCVLEHTEETLRDPNMALSIPQKEGTISEHIWLILLAEKDQITYPFAWLPATGLGVDGFVGNRLFFKAI